MGVGSFLEVYTTLFGWLLYDNVWSVLSDTGLAYIPFFTVIIRNFSEPYMSQEAKDAASVSQRRMELDIIAMFVAVIIVVSPWMNLTLGSQTYTEACSASPAVTGGATGTTYDTIFTTTALGGSVAKVPIWWYMVMNLSGAINDSVIAGINCTVDVRQVQYEVNNTKIKDKSLKDDLSKFHNECYLEGLAKIAENPSAAETSFNAGTFDDDDRDWIGSKFFTNTAGYYDSIRATSPVDGFAYNATRDIEYDSTVATPTNGRPTCKDWWTTATTGLNARLNNEIPAAKNASLTQFGALIGNTLAETREDALKTVLLNSSVTVDSLDRMALQGLNSEGSNEIIRGAKAGVKHVTAGVTGAFAWFISETTLITIQNLMPTMQALILMTIYFLLPFVLVMGGYKWEVIITATFVIFGIRFLTTIFAVLLYIGNNLFGAINQFSPNALVNSIETKSVGEIYVDLAVFLMWVIMPSLWMGMIGWAGYKSAASVSTGASNAKQTGDQGTRAGGSGAGKIASMKGKS